MKIPQSIQNDINAVEGMDKRLKEIKNRAKALRKEKARKEGLR